MEDRMRAREMREGGEGGGGVRGVVTRKRKRERETLTGAIHRLCLPETKILRQPRTFVFRTICPHDLDPVERKTRKVKWQEIANFCVYVLLRDRSFTGPS
jgi:hypothetical protein